MFVVMKEYNILDNFLLYFLAWYKINYDFLFHKWTFLGLKIPKQFLKIQKSQSCLVLENTLVIG